MCFGEKLVENVQFLETAHLDCVISLPGKWEEGGELQVWIKEAKNLTAAKSGGTSDSFVKG